MSAKIIEAFNETQRQLEDAMSAINCLRVLLPKGSDAENSLGMIVNALEDISSDVEFVRCSDELENI